MAYCHIGHDCVLGDKIVMSNATQVAGEVHIDDWAVIGGGTCIPQFSMIGKHSMTSGMSGVNKDVPPFAYAGRTPIQYCGINIVGMTRRGFKPEQIEAVKNIYRIIYQSGLNLTKAVEKIKEEIPQCEERDEILNFIATSQHGILKGPKLD
jgi:UDP-N-acetylglucosamine acyltransferase